MSFAPTKPREYGTTKELVARLIDEAGGVKRAAFLCGRAPSQVYAYAGPDVDSQMSLAMARRLSAVAKSSTLADDAAAISGGVFMPVAPSNDPISELSAKSAEEHGELMSALMRALGDGKITGDEARELLAELDGNLRALVAMRAKLVAITEGAA